MKAYLEDLTKLLEQIDHGELALPDFQRDFDWTESEAAELLVTVLNDWPAGSLLLMARGSEFFSTRAFEYAPSADQYRHLVLDGQQRLTSLYHACADRGPAVYAVLLDELSPQGDVEQSVLSVSREVWDSEFPSPVEQYRRRLVPFASLASSSSFFRWRDAVLDGLSLGDRESARDELSRLYSETLRNVERYRFPVVLYESDLEPASVARIFERVNRTGQRLSTWDLMVAKLYKPEWNLRQQWDVAQSIDDFVRAICTREGLPILQAMALRYSSDVRQSAVLRLTSEIVHDQWTDFVTAMSTTGRFLSTVGMSSAVELPYGVFRTVLCAVAVGADLEGRREELTKWVWSRTFSTYFDSAVNSKAVADYRSLRDGQPMPGPESDVGLSAFRLSQATRRSSRALWLGLQAFIRVRLADGPSDLTAGDLVPFSLLDGFGAAESPPRETPYRQRVLGLAMAPRHFVGQVKRFGLDAAIAAHWDRSDEGRATHWLAANGLPTEADHRRALFADPQAFIDHRLAWLAESLEPFGLQMESL